MASPTSDGWDWNSIYRKSGLLEKLFAALLAIWAVWYYFAPRGAMLSLLQLTLFFLGAWVLVRWLRKGTRHAIWRLRNRLYVTYLFIAVVPICLILILTAIGTYIFTGQIAVYLVTSELERRTASMRSSAEWLVSASEARRNESLREMASYYERKFPGLELLIRDKNEIRFPENARIVSPPAEWKDISGMVYKDRQLYAWARATSGAREVIMMTPLTAEYLSDLVPNLGDVSYLAFSEDPSIKIGKRGSAALPSRRETLPPAVNRADVVVDWFTLIPVAMWDKPPQTRNTALSIRTRFSAVLRSLTSPQTDLNENFAPILFLFASILFLLVELVALLIGITLTRTITGAVHNIYEGTERVREGDFSHRIEVKGQDQLAELGTSFNRMTANLERLLAVAKEKERMQAELELAREVQSQLYPKTVPAMKTLDLIAVCNPARMVSGDYFDYQALMGNKVAIAVGDVAGKGISAALLMATVGSSMRTQLRNCMEQVLLGGGTHMPMPTSQLVAQLNQQIFNDTAPEKYLTFYFGVYDDDTSILTYTNAGHLPPIVIRDGKALRLDVNGTVVGAFPFAEYGESTVKLESGDLFVCFTDGITEPENEYGEMFGEDRLIDVLARHVDRDDQQVVNAVMEAVQEWTGSPELQDDMTMLMARRR